VPPLQLCNVLQRSSLLQCNVLLQHGALRYNMSCCVETYCALLRALQCVALCCAVLQRGANVSRANAASLPLRFCSAYCRPEAA
jgi:hypothetical protein